MRHGQGAHEGSSGCAAARGRERDGLEVGLGKFTLAFNDGFVQRWATSLVREGVKARAVLPPGFHEELDRRVALDVGSADQRLGAAV